MCDMPTSPGMDEERQANRGRRDSEVLRDAAEIRADSGRMKHAMKHLEHARNAMEEGKRKGGKRKGFRGKTRD